MTTRRQFDDIVIGSGLAALATVMGLSPRRRVLVIGGPVRGRYLHYDDRAAAPCAYLGAGGLGNAWHGVIPMALHEQLAPDATDLLQLFGSFYPRALPAARAGSTQLFIPWRPIRPLPALSSLASVRGGRLEISPQWVTRFAVRDAQVEVFTSDNHFRASRLWVAAGALHSPALLDRSLGQRVSRGRVSDHVLCYAGHVDGIPAPVIKHMPDGMFISAFPSADREALYTVRPARFSFRQLDHGIEQRAAFGLPTGSAVAKVMRAMSAGLVAEALYNRFGLFARSERYSVYAQVEVPDAYELFDDPAHCLRARTSAIRARTDAARHASPFAAMVASRQPDLYIPGIHLHHSIDVAALRDAGVNCPASIVQVVDASVLAGIGPEHHSFRMMLGAWQKARCLD